MAFITTTANSISSGGTINGDITIEGDLTVNGDGAGAYDEIVNGNLRLDTPGSVATTLEFVPTASQSSQIKFYQDDGSTQDARIFAPEGATKLAFEAGTTEMMRMTTTGIGIGTTSPQKKVDIVDIYSTGGSSNEDLQLLIRGGNADLDPTGDSIGLGFGYGSADNYVKSGIVHEFTSANGSGTLHFCTSSVSGTDTINKGDSRMSISSSGKVQIGTASNTTDVPLMVNDKILIHQDSGGAGDSELTFDRRHDGAVARIQAKAGASGAMGTELHFVTKLAGGSEGTALVLDDNQKAGIGTETPDTLLHIFKADASQTAHSDSLLTLENSGHTYMTILSGTSSHGQIHFGDSGQNDDGVVGYDQATSKFYVLTNHSTTKKLVVDANGNVGIGTSSPSSAAGANALDIVDTNTSSSSQGASLRLGSNDGGAMGDDHRLGVISFRGSEDGAGTMTEGARIDAICDAGWSATENGASLRFFTTDGNAVETERMIITSGGNIGFGVQPSYKLDVSGDMRVEQTADATIATFIGSDGNNATIEIHADDGDDNADKWRMTANTAGALAIGSYSTGSWVNHLKLDANSRFSLSNNDSGGSGGSDSTTGNTLFGAYAGLAIADGGVDNNFFGHAAGNKLTTGDYNVGVGNFAGFYNVTGSRNTYVGYGAGWGNSLNQSNSDNTSVGFSALKLVATGIDNVAIGAYAGINTTTGSSNVHIGKSAGNAFNSSQVTAIGALACGSINSSNGDGTTAVGYYALKSQTSGQQNTAVGSFSSDDITTGSYNTAVGRSSLASLTTGSSNVAIGRTALSSVAGEESYNIAIGNQAMGSMDEGTAGGDIDYNIAIGENALIGGDLGSNNRQVQKNIAIGHNALDATSNGEIIGAVAIGHNALSASQAVIGTGLGYLALEDMTTGVGNTALGYRACEQVTVSGYNTVVGHQALNSEIQGSHNVALGYQALYSQNKGSAVVTANIGIGVEAGYHNDTGVYNVWLGYKAGTGVDGNSNNNNVGIGFEAAKGITTANGSVCIGYQAGTAITSGIHNICIGYQAGNIITEGQGNVLIGTGAVPSHAVNIDDSIVISAGTDALQGGVTESIRIGVDSDYIENVFGTDANWAHSSDERIKKDIKDNTLGLDFINDLRTVTFKKKAPSEYPKEFNTHNETKTERNNPDKVSYGFIAQEVKEAMDKAGHSDFTAWSEGEDTMQMLAESALITPLVKAIQELTARVKELESKL